MSQGATSLMKLIDKLKKDKNLTADLGVRLDLSDWESCQSWILIIYDGYLFYDEKKLNDEILADAVRFLETELPSKQVNSKDLWELNWDEALLVLSQLGIVSLRQIGPKKVGNSRFWARKLRRNLA